MNDGMGLEPGSVAWLIREQLKHQGIELGRSCIRWSSDEKAYWPANHGVAFIAERLQNTTCFEDVDIDYLIQRSIGGLAVILNMAERRGFHGHHDNSTEELAGVCTHHIERLHRTFCDHRHRNIETALEAIRASTNTLTTPEGDS